MDDIGEKDEIKDNSNFLETADGECKRLKVVIREVLSTTECILVDTLLDEKRYGVTPE
jgi:hypothetical protein